MGSGMSQARLNAKGRTKGFW